MQWAPVYWLGLVDWQGIALNLSGEKVVPGASLSMALGEIIAHKYKEDNPKHIFQLLFFTLAQNLRCRTPGQKVLEIPLTCTHWFSFPAPATSLSAWRLTDPTCFQRKKPSVFRDKDLTIVGFLFPLYTFLTYIRLAEPIKEVYLQQ